MIQKKKSIEMELTDCEKGLTYTWLLRSDFSKHAAQNSVYPELKAYRELKGSC